MLGIGERQELPTILLIDDDLVSREVIATVLTLDGYAVHTAEDGAGALALLAAGEVVPGLVLMDAQLPKLSGKALVKKLRAATKAQIFVVSGSEITADFRAAADGFLLKPFNPDTLRALLAEKKVEPAAAVAAVPVVNPEVLGQFRQLMPEPTVKQIYEAVVTDLNKRVVALQEAIAAGNSGEVSRIGHAIKGGCGMAGAMEAAALGARLESRSDNLEDCKIALDELLHAIENLQGMLIAEFSD
jgi:CheY-like chemotaxis protein